MAKPKRSAPAPPPRSGRRSTTTASRAAAAVPPTEADEAARVAEPAPAAARTATCRHCQQPLVKDWLWGWMHEGRRYLCQDPATGELLCQPATPA